MNRPAVDVAPLWVKAAAQFIRRMPVARYRAVQAVSRHAPAPFWARLPDDLGGCRFRCDLRDALMSEAYLTGRYEPQETALLHRILRPGMTFVDVGANWGYFTLLAFDAVGPSGRVVSVEADPRAVEALRANLDANGLDSGRVFAVAAADRPGRLSMQDYAPGAGELGNFGLAQATTVTPGGRRFEISARPLDDVLDEAGVERVDLLKMDIEGAEASAIEGLARRLGEGRVTRILLELHEYHLRDLGRSAAEVVSALSAHGYHGWRIDHSPGAHRRAVSARFNPALLLSPLNSGDALGTWPHVLWSREAQPW